MVRAFHPVNYSDGTRTFVVTRRKKARIDQPTEVAEKELVKKPPLNTHCSCNPPKNLDAIIDCNRFGSFQKLIQVTSYVLKFAKLSQQYWESLLHDPSPSELTTAELYWIQSVQSKSFYNEIQYLKYHSQQQPIRVDQFDPYRQGYHIYIQVKHSGTSNSIQCLI